MTTAQQSPSYRDIKEKNAADNRYFTIFLSRRILDDPVGIHCVFCGFMIFAANALPEAVIEGKLLAADLKERSIDVRCRKCKATCRVT